MPNVGTVRQRAKRTGVAEALFTQTQQRVLSLIFGQPDRVFLQRDLIEQARSGSGAVRRELDRLVESGLVTVARVGSQKHYQANPQSPVFEDLRSIIRKTSGLTDPLREALAPLKKKIKTAFVYGSVARGEEHAKSDIDLMIVSDDLTLEEVIRRLLPVEKLVTRTINPTLYTTDEFETGAKSAFLRKVLAGQRIVLIGSDDADS
jgi:predicted nucleotidyltransferase